MNVLSSSSKRSIMVSPSFGYKDSGDLDSSEDTCHIGCKLCPNKGSVVHCRQPSKCHE